MKILLLGSNGQLGYEATRTLFCYGDLIAVDFPDIDFTKPDEIIRLIKEVKPDLIYNAVAYTDVDKAESEIEKASLINNITPGEIANYCYRQNIPLIHFSTDYVFDGKKNALYVEEDIPNPLNVYGKTKLDGELAIQASGCDYLIFRTSWVYSMRTGGFVNKVIKWAQENEELRIVDDQIGNPTWARMLAIVSIFPIIKNWVNNSDFFEKYKGIFHLAGGGYASRYEWTNSIVKYLPKDNIIKIKDIIPVKSTEFPTPANRPLLSALNCEKFEKVFTMKIPHWEKSLNLMLNN
jgi:dTDP-4-dehydrorhamnose reductase